MVGLEIMFKTYPEKRTESLTYDTESLTYYCNENKFRATMGAINILGKLIHRRILLIEEETVNEQPV